MARGFAGSPIGGDYVKRVWHTRYLIWTEGNSWWRQSKRLQKTLQFSQYYVTWKKKKRKKDKILAIINTIFTNDDKYEG